MDKAIFHFVEYLLRYGNLLPDKRYVRAVNKAIAILGDDYAFLYEVHYRKNLPWKQVCAVLHISEHTFFRHRNKLVNEAAAVLGLVNWDYSAHRRYTHDE